MNAVSYNLARFMTARAGTFSVAVQGLRAQRKRGHWMWFVFPQLKGPGFSAMSQSYGIDGLAEIAAHLEHPLLGSRLEAAVEAVLSSRSA